MLTYFAWLVYFLPSIVAIVHLRKATPNIFLLNLFLGWTVVGWVACIVLLFAAAEENPT
jgi:Superinfection immunity protein